MDTESKIVFFLVTLAAVPQVLTAFFPNSPLLTLTYNIYTPFEFLLIYLLLGNKLQTSSFKIAALGIVVLFIILSFLLIAMYGITGRFLNEWVCVANISYLFWIFLFILENLLSEKKLLNTRLPLFWFICGLLLYTPCTIFVFALWYYINKSTNSFVRNLWIIHEIFNTLLYLLFAVGLYKNKLNKKNYRYKV